MALRAVAPSGSPTAHRRSLLVIVANCARDEARRQARAPARLVLEFWVGMSQVEIARALGVSEATVSRRWDAAAAGLRGHLSTALGNEDQ